MVGNSGSGKTTLARDLAGALGVAHVELDALYHGPGWTEPTREEFQARVAVALDGADDGWVACGNYSAVRTDVVWPRADTVVFLASEESRNISGQLITVASGRNPSL